MSDLIGRLNAARTRAEAGGMPVRRKDATLYSLLAECLSICEEVLRDGQEAALRTAVEGEDRYRKGKGRRYIEAGTDVYVMVARYVLQDRDSRNSYYRYAITMREAARRQIRGGDLADWLARNGGVNALFKTRELQSQSAFTRTLSLTESVEVPKDGEFTLTLRRTATGYFDVISTSTRRDP